MRKYNEGYVLAMVMAVIAVLALVASAMLSIGLRNVQTQQAAIDRLQKRYDAEGAIEKVVAQFGTVKTDGETTKIAAENEFSTKLDGFYKSYRSDDGVEITQPQKAAAGTYTFKISAKNNTITVDAQVELTCKVEEIKPEYEKKEDENTEESNDPEEGNNTEIKDGTVYIASVEAIKFVSYETSTTTDEPSGEVPSE